MHQPLLKSFNPNLDLYFTSWSQRRKELGTEPFVVGVDESIPGHVCTFIFSGVFKVPKLSSACAKMMIIFEISSDVDIQFAIDSWRKAECTKRNALDCRSVYQYSSRSSAAKPACWCV